MAAPYLRFRQVCLVAPALEPVAGDLSFILGLDICFRDPAVGVYGLENALWSVGDMFIEIVAPMKAGTAAGRFLDRSRGHGGYMAIFDCDHPNSRGAACNAMGVSTAVAYTHGALTGVQLHPRDCRAAMIEFNHTEGGDADSALYAPAGPDWRRHVRKDQTQRIVAIDVETPDPAGLAAHWSRIAATPVTKAADGTPSLQFAEAAVRFVPAAPGAPECIGALTVQCVDPAAVLQRAASRAYMPFAGAFHIAGVHVRPVTEA